jgi:hypothetical protein
MTVGELKAKLKGMDNNLDVVVNAKDVMLGNMGMNPGEFYVHDIKVAPAFGFGQVAEIAATVNE